MIFAHEVDYWKTGSKRSPAQWVELAIKQLRDHGAAEIVQAVGERGGATAYMLQFSMAGEQYRIVWPVLPLPPFMHNDSNERSAHVQAATSLYHEVKHSCVRATRYGSEFAFKLYQSLPDGRTVQELSAPELIQKTAFAALPPPDQKGE